MILGICYRIALMLSTLHSHRVSHKGFKVSSWQCFFKILQRFVEEENKQYILCTVPKKLIASVEHLEISSSNRFKLCNAHRVKNALELSCLILDCTP